MSTQSSAAVAAIAGGTMLALSFSPASAFTLSGPSLEQPVASSQIDKVWCRWGRCGYGYGHGYGWGPFVGGLAAGAIIGGALAGPYYGGYYHNYSGDYYGNYSGDYYGDYHGGYYGSGYRRCWRGYYGHLHCSW